LRWVAFKPTAATRKKCPTGVTTQDPLRQQALVVSDKAERVWMFHQNTLEALKELVQAAGPCGSLCGIFSVSGGLN
jgi:glutamate synthase domain-containing protein 2